MEEQGTSKAQVDGSIPSPNSKENMQALHDICAGKIRAVEFPASHVSSEPLMAVQEVQNQNRAEIPICGKTWWEESTHYECLMDRGHREALANKHGLRGMVRKLDQ